MIIQDDDSRQPIDFAGGNIIISENISLVKLISSGGNSLVYLALINGVGCILKEYYPFSDASKANVLYYRDESSGKLLFDKANISIDKEIKRQEEALEFEKRINKIMFSNPDLPGDNSNHVLPMLNIENNPIRWGDTYYLAFDTRRGKTLFDKIKDNNGKLDILSAIEISCKLIDIVNDLIFKKGYVHCDLKPENIWCGNDGENDSTENLYIIDFGSTVSYKDIAKRNVESEEEMIKFADDILNNPGIGCSTRGYCSNVIMRLCRIKKKYSFLYNRNSYTNRKRKCAQMLVDAAKEIDITVDLYSIVKIFYFMITGTDYDSTNYVNGEELALQIKSDKSVGMRIKSIMQKNNRQPYDNPEVLKTELMKIKALLRKEAIPEVWRYEVENGTGFQLDNYSEKYVSEIKIEK